MGTKLFCWLNEFDFTKNEVKRTFFYVFFESEKNYSFL